MQHRHQSDESGHGTQAAAGLLPWLTVSLAAGLFLIFASFTPAVLRGEVLLWQIDWVPDLGIAAAFMLDGLALIFSLLITGIGALVLLYAGAYMQGRPRAAWLQVLLSAFMLAMLGLVLSRDLITLFVFWELTSLISWLLIGIESEDARARRNALQALLITAGGGLALLAGLVLLGLAAGSGDLAEILAGEALGDNPQYFAILALILAGAFTKSAQVPFHIWLPNAMSAPTPVSAYLHSATMVKAGIYLLARLHPVLADSLAWTLALGIAGLVTAVHASLLAMRQTDLKQILACTTLSALGILTLLLAGTGQAAVTAALVFLLVHAFYKAALFMLAGVIEHGTGSRDIRQLGGLGRAMPVSAFAAVLAAGSMAGLPPALGWHGKELIYGAAPGILPDLGGVLMTAGLVLVNAVSFALALRLTWRPFTGAPGAAGAGHEAPWPMLAGPVVLALAGLGAGIFAPCLVAPVISATIGQPVELHMWHGFNAGVMLSLATYALGFVIWRRAGLPSGATSGQLPSLDRGWDRLLDGLRALAAWQTRLIQPGQMTRYVEVTLAALMLAMLFGLWQLGLPGPGAFDGQSEPVLWLISGFALVGAGLALQTGSRILALGGMGTVGLAVALIFIWFGAPDVAITQLMVEALSVVLLTIALLRLPGLGGVRRGHWHGHLVLALGTGLCFGLVVLAVSMAPGDRSLTAWFEAHALSAAHGRNIVNVILVDFRAFDTLGEISVVMLAALGARALLRRSKEP